MRDRRRQQIPQTPNVARLSPCHRHSGAGDQDGDDDCDGGAGAGGQDGDGNDDGDDVQLGLSRRKVKSIHSNTDYNHKWRSGFCLK